MLFFSDRGVDPYFAQLQELSGECFDCTEVSPADIRFVDIDRRKRVIAHSAAIKREFRDLALPLETWLLGYVSVREDLRGKGLGRKAVEEILKAFTKKEEWAILLNCSLKNAPFYEKFRFERIANKASYIRDGKFVIDEDPVLMMYKSKSDITVGHRDTIHFGEDF